MTIPTTDTTSRPDRRERAGRVGVVVGLLVTVAMCVLVAQSREASADAGFGVGRYDITTNGFTHPWLGGYATNVGTAWCIQSGRAYPRAAGNTHATDLPAERGVSSANRKALAYALWAYTATRNPTTAAGLAAAVHGLSGDDYASIDVPSMVISDPAVKAAAVAIYHEARNRAFWVSNPAVDPWKITTTLRHRTGMVWDAVTTVTTSYGRPIAGHRVGLVPYNVAERSSTEHVFVTDAHGRIRTSWTQTDATRPVVIDAQTTAPTTYRVWKGPNYPGGSIPQRIVTSGGTIYRGHAQKRLPTGRIRLFKSTDNAAYQTAAGATFDVIARGVSTSVGTLTVGASGVSNSVELPVGDYVVTETWAPAGVLVDTTPYPVTVTAHATAELTLTDPVLRRAGVSLLKVDVVTNEPVAGAELLVERDDDGDGTYETTVGAFTSSLTPTRLDSLAAGDYRITETAPPDGYELPEDTVQEVGIGWDQTATVTFADHRSVAVTTESKLVTGDPDLPEPPAGLADVAHVVASVGNDLSDTVSITGLAPGEAGTVTASLYGPTTPGEPVSCTPEQRVHTDSWATTGSGTSTSGAFTPEVAGLYTWVATVEVPGFGTVTGPCGEISESAVLTPTIDTVAQAQQPTPGANVSDEISVTGLAEGTGATVHTALYGPFTSPDEMRLSCAAADLGDPVGVVHDPIVQGPTSPTVVSSSPIALPGDAIDGWYTFSSTLDVAGFPPISHDCGAEAETFHVSSPTTTTTAPPPSTTTPPSTTPPSTTPPTTLPPAIAPPPSSTTTSSTTTSPTTAPPPRVTLPPSTTTTTTLPVAPPPSNTAPPVNPGSGPAVGRGNSVRSAGELPRTGSDSGRLAAVGTALMLIGAAVSMLIARHRTRVGS